MRPTMKEIFDEGLTEEVWSAAEARNRKQSVRRDRNRFRQKGYIRAVCTPTPLVLDPNGPIKCENGTRYSIGHETTYVRSNH